MFARKIFLKRSTPVFQSHVFYSIVGQLKLNFFLLTDVVVVQPDLTQNALHIRKEDYSEKSVLASLGANAVVPLLPPPPKYMNNNCQKDDTHQPLIGKLKNGSLDSTEKIPRPESPASEVNSSGK